jgi:hypothetical protein
MGLLLWVVTGCDGADVTRFPYEEEPPHGRSLADRSLFFTGPEFDERRPVTEYVPGDSIYVLAIERESMRPTYAPIWLYSTWSYEVEVLLMRLDRAAAKPYSAETPLALAVATEVALNDP